MSRSITEWTARSLNESLNHLHYHPFRWSILVQGTESARLRAVFQGIFHLPDKEGRFPGLTFHILMQDVKGGNYFKCFSKAIFVFQPSAISQCKQDERNQKDFIYIIYHLLQGERWESIWRDSECCARLLTCHFLLNPPHVCYVVSLL